MSGSNCMCVVTALLETGRVPMREPETIVRLDTPAGLVVARARCEDGRCLSVSLDNVAAFVEELDKTIETPALGTHQGRHRVRRHLLRHRRCRSAGHRHRPEERAHARRCRHPAQGRAGEAGSGSPPHPGRHGRDCLRHVPQHRAGWRHPHLHHAAAGRVDRSPCGTGSSANLACSTRAARSRSATRGAPARSSAASSWSKRSGKLRWAAARRSCRGSPGRPGSTGHREAAPRRTRSVPGWLRAVRHLGNARRLTTPTVAKLPAQGGSLDHHDRPPAAPPHGAEGHRGFRPRPQRLGRPAMAVGPALPLSGPGR